jgi:4-amino-4-deoxy-L-arabinose transferase-like glycosyltransferase
MPTLANSERFSKARKKGYLHIIVLLFLFSFHVINNWIWAVSNVTLLGWDRSSHLAKTLIYDDILQHINIRTIFTALTWPWNRPPLPFLSVVPFYRFFGTSTDIALMSNCVFLAILLLSVYGIGRMLHNRKVGLFAAFLVSFYPILFAISRLSYVDYALTAMVSLSIYLLLKTEGFRNRRWSLVLGLGLGLGLLTKWPFIAFAGAPLGYVAFRSGALSSILFVSWGGREGASTLRRLLTSPWFHIAAALLLSLVWYLPNWDRLSGFLLGWWLPLLSWILLAIAFYILSRKPSQGTNLLSAVILGGTIASAWALPNIGFSQRFVFVAYGGVNIQGKGLSLSDPTFYGRYLSMMLTEQLSPLYFGALLLAACLLVYRSLKRASLLDSTRSKSDGAWILTLWLAVPFLIFTLSQTWNSRFNIALLPATALITARGLFDIRTSRVRVALISLLVMCGIGQFFILSYDGLHWISEKTVFSVPVVGGMNLLGEGDYIMAPNTDRTDSGYWVAPQILSLISEGTTGETDLGLLVNNTHLNADILRYLTLLEFEQVEIRDLARDESGQSAYLQVFASDYVLLTTGDPYKLSDGAKEAVRRINESPQVFNQVYELKEEYEFPDGELLSLYEKRFPPADEQVQDYYRHLVTAVEPDLGEGDAIILNPPRQLETFVQFYEGYAPVYLLPQGNLAGDILWLEGILASHDRIHAIFRAEDEVDPEHVVEHWLNEHAYRTRDEWYGDIRYTLYASPGGVQTSPTEHPLNANLGDEITLSGYSVASEVIKPGGIMQLTLFWQVRNEVTEDYAVFVHLLDHKGQLVAQRDSEPVGGSRPTTSWITDDTISDNHGLLIPESIAPGEYRLIVGMYLPATGERLPILDVQGRASGDTIFLDVIEVSREQSG